jgi:hypothetical protein
MSDVIRRRADGSWGQGDDVPTYASDRAETWSGTRDESMEHVSDEYAKYLAMQKEWNMKEDIGKLYLQKECIDLLEENEKLKRSNKELLELLEDIEKELHLAGLDQRENNAHDVSSLPAKLCIRLHAEIQKARGLQQ